jgi:FixJ family two-component response regulator
MKNRPPGNEPLVLIVDDDPSIREAIADLLRSVNMEFMSFATTADLLSAAIPDRPGCMVLDIRLPDLSGLDLQMHLQARGNRMPIIFLTGYGDIPMSVRAMKAGAADFLTKPARDQDLLDAIFAAIERDKVRRKAEAETTSIARLAATLTPREREVAAAVARGLVNKQIAHELGISEITVKLHRGSAMRKMQASSVADLINKAKLARISQ